MNRTIQMVPYLTLDRKAQEAIRFYEEALGAVVMFKQTFGEGPQNPESPIGDEDKDLVAHAVLNIGGAELMLSDQLPGQPVQAGNQVNICVITDDAEKARQLFDALARNGQVIFPMSGMYFSPAYGMVTDAFGVTFQLFTKRAVQ